jgi:peptidoglycan/xylan/chitin deacetylase (PgdA/CDA1 family)
MDCAHSSAVDEATERQWIRNTLEVLGPFSERPIRGWLGPARSQSGRTPELLAEAGLGWCADWVNDELPYRFHTTSGDLVNLPLSLELEDRFIIGDNLHSETEYADQLIDAADLLLAEGSKRGGRLLALNLHPWVIGQPHRIGQLERVFEHLRAFGDQLWNASPTPLIAAAGLGQED